MVNPSVYVFDPTATDTQSKVRGIGRYIDTLMEALGASGKRVTELSEVPSSGTLLHPFFNFLVPPLINKRVAAHQIAVIHDLIPFKYPRSFPIGIRGKITVWKNKKSLSLYDKIITDSQTSKADIVHILGLRDSMINVVYPSIASLFSSNTMPQISPELRNLLRNVPRFFIYVGDATWNKNLVNLARAIRIARIPCLFVGKVFTTASSHHPWQEELELFRKEAQNDPLFLFSGFITNDDLRYAYQHALGNMLVSHDEGFGFSYLEAGSQRCPSILADRPIFHEISLENAIFANPEDPQDIADQMRQLAESESGRKELGMKAYEQSKHFSTKDFRTSLMKTVLL